MNNLRSVHLALCAALAMALACESGAGLSAGEGKSTAAPAVDGEGGNGAEGVAAPKPLPAAEAVFAAHVEASGGAAAMQGVKRMHIESELELPSRGIKGRSEVWWDSGRFAVVDTLPQLGVNRAGYDGERVWTQDAVNSWRDLEGEEAELYKRGASPFLVADYKEHFASIKSVGRREVEGRTLIDVRARSPLGQEMMMSFDEESGLLAESAFDEVGPAVDAKGGRATRVVSSASDYRQVGPLKLAHKQVTRSGVGEVIQQVVRVELDPAIDQALLAHPEAGERVPADPKKQPEPKLD